MMAAGAVRATRKKEVDMTAMAQTQQRPNCLGVVENMPNISTTMSSTSGMDLPNGVTSQ